MQDCLVNMMIGRKAVLIGMISLPLSFYFVYFIRIYIFPVEDFIIEPHPISKKTWAIDTPGCQIPLLDPMHPSIRSWYSPKAPLNCTTKLPSPIVPGNNPKTPSIRLIKKTLQLYGNNITCNFVPLQRKSEHTTIEGKPQPINKEEINISDEFVKVECVNQNNSNVFRDFFPFIQRKKNVEKRYKNSNAVKETDKTQRLSVLLIGMDSVSRNNYIRHMKKTDKYLKENTVLVDMNGYNKIGLNTYPNLIAMLGGHLEEELPKPSKVYANDLPIIWKEFAKTGYRILFSEDKSSIAIFNYAKKGFSDQPTDYYMRPFNRAIESSTVVSKGKWGCYNGRLEADVILNWTGDLFDVFPEDPLFALTFLSRLSHDNMNDVSLQDEPYQRLFKRLHDSGHLNRTIVFFFGDHGYRFGSIRTTYIGRMEDKLPFMIILVPTWFPSKYPTLFANLKANGKRLTSPLDIYATLQGILNFPEFLKNKSRPEESRSMNLFESVIPDSRTCENINITFQFCACAQLQQIESTDKRVLKAAQKLVDKINEITKDQRKNCSELKLDEITQATVQLVHIESSDKNNVSANYQVTFKVQPSKGLFEGSVWYLIEKNTYTVHPGIDRVNLYGNQSSCITISSLKPYCYCSKS